MMATVANESGRSKSKMTSKSCHVDKIEKVKHKQTYYVPCIYMCSKKTTTKLREQEYFFLNPATKHSNVRRWKYELLRPTVKNWYFSKYREGKKNSIYTTNEAISKCILNIVI